MLKKNDGVEERSGAREIIATLPQQGSEVPFSRSKVTSHLDEVVVLPAPNVLGQRALRVFVLGGGTGSTAFLAQQYPQVENIVVVELDVDVVNFAKKYFFQQREAFSDPRTELVIDDALAWVMRQNSSSFDAIVVNLCRGLWRQASGTSRVPRTRRFMRKLPSLLACPVASSCRTSATLRHQVTPGDCWTCIGTVLLQCGPRLTRIRHNNWKPMKHLVGGVRDHPSFSRSAPLDGWMYVMWTGRAGTACSSDQRSTTQRCTPFSSRCLLSSRRCLMRHLSLRLESWRKVSKTLHDGAVLVTAPLAEGHGCNSSFLNSVSEAASLLHALATLSGLTSLGELSHQFQPLGVTALLLLAEAHISIHTSSTVTQAHRGQGDR